MQDRFIKVYALQGEKSFAGGVCICYRGAHHRKPEVLNKEAYYESIINTTVELGTAEEFIVVLSELIQRLAVDHLHVLGDIYDRGAGPHLIMDRLCRYHSLDIQWGNHDIIWMGQQQEILHVLQLLSETVSDMVIWTWSRRAMA